VADIEKAERDKMRAKVHAIMDHGINCFVNRQLIYNFPEEIFADAGVMAIEHADFDGIERLALVTGALHGTLRLWRKGKQKSLRPSLKSLPGCDPQLAFSRGMLTCLLSNGMSRRWQDSIHSASLLSPVRFKGTSEMHPCPELLESNSSSRGIFTCLWQWQKWHMR
jgi:hypothetical protein